MENLGPPFDGPISPPLKHMAIWNEMISQGLSKMSSML